MPETKHYNIKKKDCLQAWDDKCAELELAKEALLSACYEIETYYSGIPSHMKSKMTKEELMAYFLEKAGEK
jgi:hypothetical protein